MIYLVFLMTLQYNGKINSALELRNYESTTSFCKVIPYLTVYLLTLIEQYNSNREILLLHNMFYSKHHIMIKFVFYFLCSTTQCEKNNCNVYVHTYIP